jgi:hypothetical protein
LYFPAGFEARYNLAMAERKPFPLAIMALFVVALLLGVYVTGYFYSGKKLSLTPSGILPTPPPPKTYRRIYPYRWQAIIFHPAAQVESLLGPRPVDTMDQHTWEYGP